MITVPPIRRSLPLLVLLVLLSIGQVPAAQAQEDGPALGAAAAQPDAGLGTAFTYQGRLNDGSSSANGPYDFEFKLFDAATGGTQAGTTVSKQDVAVSGGLFTVELDFGAGAFNGQARWLEVGVRPGADTGAYTVLSPRRPLLASPYATYSANSGGLKYDGVGWPFHVGTGTFGLYLGNATSTGMVPMVMGRGQDADDMGLYFVGMVDTDTGTRPVVGVSGRMSSNANVRTRPIFEVDNFRTPILTAAANFNVGIGTSTPKARLEVNNGTLLVSGGTALGQDSARLVVDTGASFGHSPLELRNDKNGVLFKVFGDGRAQTKVLQVTGGADLAERFRQTGDVTAEPGTVMVIDAANPGHLTVSRSAYDTRVAGIVSGAGDVKPGLVLSQEGVMEGDLAVAMAGRVYARCEAASGPIEPGDLLTTSDFPGHCMKAGDKERRDGAVLGKAMTGLAEGEGLVLVLVNLQ